MIPSLFPLICKKKEELTLFCLLLSRFYGIQHEYSYLGKIRKLPFKIRSIAKVTQLQQCTVKHKPEKEITIIPLLHLPDVCLKGHLPN